MINLKNKQIFKDLVANASWENIFSYNDTQSAFTAFHSKLVKLYDQAFPKKRIKLTYRTKKPWLTEGLNISVKRKNVLYYLGNMILPIMKCSINHIEARLQS